MSADQTSTGGSSVPPTADIGGPVPSSPTTDDGRTLIADSAGEPAPATSSLGGTRFRVVRFHARGGLGEVFVAEDAELGRPVALKGIRSDRAGDPANRKRFVREAEITGGLEHPGVVPVYSLGSSADGLPYYDFSDLVAGGTQWIDRHGVAHPVTVNDIVIVAPYNAHVGAIERACALCENNMIMSSDLPPQIVEFANEATARKSRGMLPVGKSLDEFIQEQEREYIEATLAKFKGSREKAASVLGISMATLYRKLEIKGKK